VPHTFTLLPFLSKPELVENVSAIAAAAMYKCLVMDDLSLSIER
jgi:hypothetical protein